MHTTHTVTKHHIHTHREMQCTSVGPVCHSSTESRNRLLSLLPLNLQGDAHSFAPWPPHNETLLSSS